MEEFLLTPTFCVEYFSNECFLSVSVSTNMLNARYWRLENPEQIQEHNTHSLKDCVVSYLRERDSSFDYILNEIVPEDDYFKLLNNYIRSEAEMFPKLHYLNKTRRFHK